jgi:transcriptional regulator with XRE-family HTH domain
MDIRGETLFRHELGIQLRRLRRDRGERLIDTARRAGISPQYLSEIERGLKDPSSEMLAAVAGALETAVGEIAVTVGQRLTETHPTVPRLRSVPTLHPAPSRGRPDGPQLRALASAA